VEVGPTPISNVTEAVLEEVRAWQNRPLDAIYPIVYLDALYLKIRLLLDARSFIEKPREFKSRSIPRVWPPSAPQFIESSREAT
jgi:hypothetical protein